MTSLDPIETGHDDEPSLRRVALAGGATVALAFGGFLTWAILAHLDNAAVAPGVVIVDSHRKTVQHLEGGILGALLVRDGERVTAGQPLLRLDGTQPQAQLAQMETQIYGARVRQTRLRAEERDLDEPGFSDELRQAADTPERKDILRTEEHVFHARHDAFRQTVALLTQRITGTEPQIAALVRQRAAVAEQIGYLRDQLAGARQLYEHGNEKRLRLLDLEGKISELTATLSDVDSRASQANQAVIGSRLDIVQQRNTRTTDIFTQLQQAEAQIGDLTDRIRGARDILRRTLVLSPQDGKVTNIRMYTVGGVIKPGEPILDIVPSNDELVVEAQVDPQDIDSVHAGLPASVRLTAYSQRLVPIVDGEVSYVAADMETEQRTGHNYYTVRARFDQEGLAKIKQVHLTPGMPAEVLVITARRQAIDYFLSPIMNAMTRAGHER